jgi:hypothetical protein
MLSVIEESFTGKDKKRRALLEEDMLSLPTAVYPSNFMNKKRRTEEEQKCLSSQGSKNENIDPLDAISLPI